MAARSRSLVVLALLATLPGCSGRAPEAPSARAQMSFGVSMAQRGLWSEALFRFEQVARLEPQNARAQANTAVALEALGKFDDAKAAYERAVKLDPSNPDIKRNQARFQEFFQGFKPKPAPTVAVPAPTAAPPPPPVPPPSGDRR